MAKGYFIVTNHIDDTPKGSVSDLQGVFSSEDAAVAACSTKKHCLIGPFKLDAMLSDEATAAEVAYFPLCETREEGQARAAEYLAEFIKARADN